MKDNKKRILKIFAVATTILLVFVGALLIVLLSESYGIDVAYVASYDVNVDLRNLSDILKNNSFDGYVSDGSYNSRIGGTIKMKVENTEYTLSLFITNRSSSDSNQTELTLGPLKSAPYGQPVMKGPLKVGWQEKLEERKKIVASCIGILIQIIKDGIGITPYTYGYHEIQYYT